MKMIWRAVAGILGFVVPFGLFFILTLIPGGQIIALFLIIAGFILGIIFGLIGFFFENVKRILRIGTKPAT